jgi:hypothetical protein
MPGNETDEKIWAFNTKGFEMIVNYDPFILESNHTEKIYDSLMFIVDTQLYHETTIHAHLTGIYGL